MPEKDLLANEVVTKNYELGFDSLLFEPRLKRFPLEAQDGAFSVKSESDAASSSVTQAALDKVALILAAVIDFHALQPQEEGDVLAEKSDDDIRLESVRNAIELDTNHRQLEIVTISEKSETNDTLRLNYICEASDDKSESSQLEAARQAADFAQEAIHDARAFFPFGERVQFDVMIMPTTIFDNLFKLVKRRGAADSTEGNCLIICLPRKNAKKKYSHLAFTTSETERISSDSDKDLYIQIRHEITHGIQTTMSSDSDFATEGIAMMVEGLHLNSNYIHGKVHRENLDLKKISEISELRGYKGYKVSEYLLYHVSHSLFRFIYDFFDNNPDKFGQMLNLLRSPSKLSLAEAFEKIFGIKFQSILPMWEHELFRGNFALHNSPEEEPSKN